MRVYNTSLVFRLCFIIAMSLCAENLVAQPFLITPIEGAYGKDFIIVNYVDWSNTGIEDHHCGTKTYDGHQGTDFSLRSFRQMDSGVNVLAGASGVVTFTKDGEFDRETISDVSKGLGNYIAIKHDNQYYTYYGHLKKNSLKVKVGDTVSSGQVIGEVGSSGNSTDAHLHFEVWFDSTNVVDPFKGPCGNASSLFLDEIPYDSTFNIWDYGMHNAQVDIDDLRERTETNSCCPYVYPTTSSNPIVLWSHMYGLKKDDVLDIYWYTPDSSQWFTFQFVMEQDWWYYYFWSFINNSNLVEGDWRVELELNGKKVLSQAFVVDDNSATKLQSTNPNECSKRLNFKRDWTELSLESTIDIRDQSGRLLHSSSPTNTREFPYLSEGIYYFELRSQKGTCVVKQTLY